MKRDVERVAITGIGVIAPSGVGTDQFADSVRSGCSGIREITAFDPDGLESRIAGEVDDASFDPNPWIHPPKSIKTMSRATKFAVAAAGMAREQAGLDPGDVDPDRLGVSLGVGGMGPTDVDLVSIQALAVLDAAREANGGAVNTPAITRSYRARTNPVSVLQGLPNLAAAHVAIQNNARGPSLSVATACAAGTQAIGEGVRMIQRDEADVVLAGGTDAAVNPVSVLGFDLLGTLSHRNEEPQRACRPFDRDRDGFVIGEGAAVLVLESENHARSRTVDVLGEAAGFGATCDAWRITDERPDATGAARALQLCMVDAAVEPHEVGYINAHGTGTQMNDVTETRAIKQVFGASATDLPISSTKSMVGHLLAAAGAVEFVACILALREGFLPPTINLDVPDPECDLDYIPNVGRSAQINIAISSSFGFGGQNACLLARRW
jgi:3-oxoacyl-[acyl-carrier-protein] synthase II